MDLDLSITPARLNCLGWRKTPSGSLFPVAYFPTENSANCATSILKNFESGLKAEKSKRGDSVEHQEQSASVVEALEWLKKEGRGEIADRLKKAKEYGDLSENAEYSEAKEAQSQIESQIIDLENVLRNSVIIKKGNGKSTIDIGADIEVEKGGKIIKYSLVGSKEANPTQNLISNQSPLGKAFIGKKVGDTVEVQTPKGKVKYKIVKID